MERAEVQSCWRPRQAHGGVGGQRKATSGAEKREGYQLLEGTGESPPTHSRRREAALSVALPRWPALGEILA